MRADYEHQLDARYAAARGYVDAIIHPEDTRAVIAAALRASLNNPGPHLGPFSVASLATLSRARTTSRYDDREDRSRRERAGILGRFARSAAPAGRRRADRLSHARLSRRSHDVDSAEAEGARSEHGLRARLHRCGGFGARRRHRARRARHRERGRRESALRARRRFARSRQKRGKCAQGRRRHRRRSAAAHRRIDRVGPSAREHGHRRAAVRRARSRAVGQRLHRLDADRRSARAGRADRHHRPHRPIPRSRWRRCATSSAGRRTITTGSPLESSPVTSSNAARSAPAATVSTTGATFPISRTSDIRSSTHRPTAASSSRSIRAPAAASPSIR